MFHPSGKSRAKYLKKVKGVNEKEEIRGKIFAAIADFQEATQQLIEV